MSITALRNELVDMVDGVSDFHDRWGVDRHPDSVPPSTDWLRSRSDLIMEENSEFATALELDHIAEEAADVLYVALGTLDLLPADVVSRAMRTVINKNDDKSHSTHYVHPQTGKVTRRSAH